MQFIWIITGIIFGGWLASESLWLFGAFAGATLLFLLSSNRQQAERLSKLQNLTDNLEAALRSVQDTQRDLRRALEEMLAPDVKEKAPVREDAEPSPPIAVVRDVPEADPYDSAPEALAPARAAATQTVRTRRSNEVTDPFEDWFNKAKNWLTTGNVPVKLGVIVSFFGVAFLLKYAVDNSIFEIPIGLRYLFVAAAASALLVVGWRLRDKNPVYALSLQGGGIGVLYLTIFAAFSLHNVLPAAMAFLLMVMLTIGAGILAVLQDARALAILGVVGGFLAPVLVSTESGNHVVLFSYYLLLNAAVLGIAWFRAWRSLNIIGFAFTFGVGTLWGNESYTPELFGTTEPFLVAFFLFYTAIAVLFAFRQPPNLRGVVDGTLVFGTPAIAFALQSLLVADTEYGLAISALVAATIYALLALWLHRSQGQQMRPLVESFAALAVTFATVAIPLALDDRWTSVSWALEGTALVWIAVRQQRLFPRLAGCALLFLSGVMFLDYGWANDRGIAFFNGNLLGAMLISLASLFSARLLATDKKPLPMQWLASAALLAWGMAWWLGSGFMEIIDRISDNEQLHWLSVFFSLSFAGLAYWGYLRDWIAANRGSLAYLFALPVIAFGYLIEWGHFFAEWGVLPWMLAIASHAAILRLLVDSRVAGVWHYAGGLFFTVMLAYEAYYLTDDAGLNETWALSAALATFLLVAAGLARSIQRIEWPFRQQAFAYGLLAASALLIQFTMLLIAVIDEPGDPSPMTYIPVLNPFDVITLGGLVVGWLFVAAVASRRDGTTPSLIAAQSQLLRTIWFAAAFMLSTIAVIRGVYHYSNLIWGWDNLLDSTSVHTALSIYWSILGIGGMIHGNRHGRRRVWVAGIALMGIVVAKLFLVDLGNTGTVARIVSFLGVGLMLLVVGYFAPAPPREAEAS